MTYPTSSILDLKTELQINGVWTDVSSFTFNNDQAAGVGITRGNGDESTSMNPSQASFGLNNADGRFTARNPTGPYYPYLVQNTPVRFSLPEGASYLRSEVDQVSFASAPDSVGLSITGDTEVQIDLTLDNWNSQQFLAGKWTSSGNQRSWLLMINENATLTFQWSSGGGTGTIKTATSTVPVALPALRRMALKATLATATGTVTFYTAPTISGSYTQLGAAVVAGAAGVFDSTSSVTVGYVPSAGPNGVQGKVHAFKLLSGIGGTVKASPDFTTQTAGATSFNDAQSNTWTLNGTAEISNRRYRFHGETVSFPQTWDPTGKYVMASVTANGVTRRLAQSQKPLNSPMYRYWTRLTGSSAPVAYWPCEDLTRASAFASALSGGPRMDVSGGASLANVTAFDCSDALPAVDSSTWAGRVTGFTQTGTIVVRFLLDLTTDVTSLGAADVVKVATSGTAGTMEITWFSAGGGLELNSDNLGILVASVPISAGKKVMVSLEMTTSGGNVTATLSTIDTAGNISTGSSTFAGTVGGISGVLVNPDPVNMGQTTVGHIAVQNTVVALSSVSGALSAYNGEAAGIRFQRLCGEQGIAFRGRGQLSVTVPMGPQGITSLSNLLQDCVDAERGAMFEPRQVLGLGFRTRYSLSNQSAGVQLDYAGADLTGLQPTNDDQNTLNDVTVQRANGSSARSVVTTGTKSIQAPPNGVGTYDTGLTLNLYTDSQTTDEAGWIAHVGTVDESRYPDITIDMSRSAIQNVYHDLQEMDCFDYLQIINPPIWIAPDTIKQLLRQQRETIGGRIFQLDWSGLPELPYETGIVGDPILGRCDTDGSTVHANITSVATTMQVDTTTGFNYPLWTTAAGDFPFDINVGGERMTVTNITGAANPQTFTVTRSVNGVVKAQTAGTAVKLFTSMVVAM
jgi:hypothetical protein